MARRHILYEVDRLQFWLTRGSVQEDEFAGSAAQRSRLALVVGEVTLEAVLLRARNVSAFLVGRRPKVGDRNELDVVADHYFDNGWANRPAFVLGPDAETHEGVKDELDRRVAHISKHRLGDQFKWTSLMPHVSSTLTSFHSFLTDLGAAHPERAAWFGSN